MIPSLSNLHSVSRPSASTWPGRRRCFLRSICIPFLGLKQLTGQVQILQLSLLGCPCRAVSTERADDQPVSMDGHSQHNDQYWRNCVQRDWHQLQRLSIPIGTGPCTLIGSKRLQGKVCCGQISPYPTGLMLASPGLNIHCPANERVTMFRSHSTYHRDECLCAIGAACYCLQVFCTGHVGYISKPDPMQKSLV